VWPTDVTDLGWSPEDRYLASVGLDSQVLIWSGYTLGGSRHFTSRSLVRHRMILFFPSKNEYAKLISITVLSRAFVGTLLESFWRLSLMTAVSKYGAQRIGNWRLRLENLSRILLGVPFFDDSGALYDVVEDSINHWI
jgi:hypothetical protein